MEHLLFYYRVKGYPIKNERQHVEEVISSAGLEGERRRLAADLSGGQKRRLSLGIPYPSNMSS
jgi:ATP-binding cassette subfamily A (ABC1) protein 3